MAKRFFLNTRTENFETQVPRNVLRFACSARSTRRTRESQNSWYGQTQTRESKCKCIKHAKEAAKSCVSANTRLAAHFNVRLDGRASNTRTHCSKPEHANVYYHLRNTRIFITTYETRECLLPLTKHANVYYHISNTRSASRKCQTREPRNIL